MSPGKSHSWLRPTSRSRPPMAARASVAEGSRLTTRGGMAVVSSVVLGAGMAVWGGGLLAMKPPVRRAVHGVVAYVPWRMPTVPSQQPVLWSGVFARLGRHGPFASLAFVAGALLLACGPASAQDAPAPDGEPPVIGENGEGEGEDVLAIDAFAEAVQLRTLVDLFSAFLGIEVILRGELEGEVSFANPREVRRSGVLPLLESLLELNDYALTYDQPTGFYVIQRAGEVRLSFEGEFATTRVIATPNVRPSGLQATLQNVLGQTGQAQGGDGIAYIDELGVILVTGSPRRVRNIERIVGQLVQERRQSRYIQIPLRFVSAPTARDRAIELVSGRSQRQAQLPVGQPRGQAAQETARPQTGDTFDNLADRLGIAPQGNALIFRGRDEEIEQVQAAIDLIDQPSMLQNKRYEVGRAAQQISDIARQRGLGEVIVLTPQDQQQPNQFNQFRQFAQQGGQNPFQQPQDAVVAGGSSMVVDVETGTVIYFATSEQHAEFEKLIAELEIERDAVITRTYKLAHANAEEVTEIILALIEDGTQTGNQGFLPTFGGQAGQALFTPRFDGAGAPGELGALRANRDTRVVSDLANNQIIVRAREREQEDFGRLIERLDLRRPQVYIEATIVSVTNNMDFRLAIETQLINAGGSGGAAQTNFGLTQAGDGFTSPRTPVPTLTGLTTALIQSQYLPFVLNAIQTDTDARIISSPSLLVDDNSEAEIVSLDQQPTTSTSQDGTSTQTSFGGFEDAGTRLTVTPRISEGGYLQLTYGIELSNFLGQGSNGIPAPRQERNIRSDSVTIPGDTTIVVGGIRINDVRETVVKVPFIGEIPILGHLFRDTREVANDAMLYVFIRPRIMRDDTFRDLRLMTEGPQASVGLPADLPLIQPVSIDVISARPFRQPGAPEPSPRSPAAEPPPGSTTEGDRPATPTPGLEPGAVRRLPPPPDRDDEDHDRDAARGPNGS
ncbi:MAG: hypothetical protein EA378_01175 [Phycisphaerales bacterium]|nr:MAG: hypothetical protein EA378_01175 [Phycisphaerales bacterium]